MYVIDILGGWLERVQNYKTRANIWARGVIDKQRQRVLLPAVAVDTQSVYSFEFVAFNNVCWSTPLPRPVVDIQRWVTRPPG